jgi:hypothetical protein
MNWFLLSLEERLRIWKEFRNSLSSKDEMTQFSMVAEFWAKAPLKTISYDITDASSWPTPWEMIRNNDWCRNSVAIGMENTLRLAGFPSERMALKFILDREIQAMLLVLVVDCTWVLNYDWGHVREYSDMKLKSLKTWTFLNKSYILND